MGENKIRLLKAEDIDCRVGNVKKDGDTIKYITLLLYKNARVDMSILDEVYGRKNWKRKHEFKDGKLYCTVSVYDEEKKEWIDKEDVGTESNADAEKGQASDAFKRACVNWGIGRELYTAPFIVIKPMQGERDVRYTKFHVAEIKYNNQEISHLVIKDANGYERYRMGETDTQQTQVQTPPPATAPTPATNVSPKPAAQVKTKRERTVNYLKSLNDNLLKQFMDYFKIEDVDKMTDGQIDAVIEYVKGLKKK